MRVNRQVDALGLSEVVSLMNMGRVSFQNLQLPHAPFIYITSTNSCAEWLSYYNRMLS